MGSLQMDLSSPINALESSASLFTRRMRRQLNQVESDGDGGLNIQADEELIITESYLKLTESIKFELVPGNDSYLDKKQFEWKLIIYDDQKIGFDIKFKYPKYISVNGLDTLKISFQNAESFMSPQENGLQSMSDGLK